MKVLGAEHLTAQQRQLVENLGVSLDSGHYETKRKSLAKQLTLVFPDVWVIGRPNNNLINAAIKIRIRQFTQVHPGSLVVSFTRAFVNEETLMGTKYRRSKKRSNSVVAYRQDGQPDENVSIAQIHSFHMVIAGNFTYLVAVAREVRKVENSVIVTPSQRTTAEQREVMNKRFIEVFKPE